MQLGRSLVFSLIAFLGLVLGSELSTAQAVGREINVAAAADLSAALQEIATNYQKRTGVVVKLSFGASGALTQQIQNGAPFDVFFSGGHGLSPAVDRRRPWRERLFVSLCRGAVSHLGSQGFAARRRAQRDGCAAGSVGEENSDGESTARPVRTRRRRRAEALRTVRKSQDRFVLGENISQAAQFVESGNAQVGFVALAHATAPTMQGKGKYWVVPAEAYPPLDQGVILISHSSHAQEAAAFLGFVKTEEAAGILWRYGFTLA